jgi:hypothetical protein
VARLPRADRNLVHNVAESVMNALLSNKISRNEVLVNAKNKNTTFEKQLVANAYDIAVAFMEEGDSRT